MNIKAKKNDPKKAKAFFQNKLDFTTGPAEVKHLMDDGVHPNIIDVRAREDFEVGHVPGAVNLPREEWDSLRGLKKEEQNILYCYSIVCHLAARAAVKFADNGFSVMEMDGGFKSWQEHNLPMETGSEHGEQQEKIA
ncbi:MAG: rhodanese-related sulfurtransferase [Bacteriovoracaceae bacterium]|nr:rhodanese-related sulfurtransferase [Bacteriovoracaceae bacterium]